MSEVLNTILSVLPLEAVAKIQEKTNLSVEDISLVVKSVKLQEALDEIGKSVIDGFSYTLADLAPERSERYRWTDQGNGYLFADWYKSVARYVPERKAWYIYDGKRWEADTAGLRVMELCKKLADALAAYALSIAEERLREDYMKYVARWQRRNQREIILKDAASVYPISMSEFDKDVYAFNCLNGTLDLRTGQFHEHRASDMLSKISGVSFDPAARCVRWERFIDEVMQGDKDKAAFLQKSLGYALTGDTSHECFFVLYGATSRNGKSTCMTTFARLMGDYARAARPETIAMKATSGGSSPSEDIARLAGARFVNISEPDKQMQLSAATVKTLTGADPITARYLNENSFEFMPQFKLFINTNHLPAVSDSTVFRSGRVKVIPFERHFEEHERDETLKSVLATPEALSGILNWTMQGLRDIDEVGFDAPESVIRATLNYRNANDKLGRFIAETLEQSPMAEVQTGVLYPLYQTWCAQNGHFPENAQKFKDALSEYGEVKRKRPAGASREVNAVNMFIGYRLLRSEKQAIL